MASQIGASASGLDAAKFFYFRILILIRSNIGAWAAKIAGMTAAGSRGAFMALVTDRPQDDR
jgi:hypothetical protein